MADSEHTSQADSARKWRRFDTAPQIDGHYIRVLLDDGSETIACWAELPKEWDPKGDWSGWMVDVKARTDLDYEITHWCPMEEQPCWEPPA